ncbi:MAG TPA: TorF family putative porin [Burkholderiaceae bacterium]|nr:TorF family putative porin [Burkholderiaceae bacterium]
MKSLFALLALSVTATAMPAWADEPASPLSFNASVTTDYRYRGISQTRLKPALQGGADYDFGNGFYAGTWASTIKWVKDGGGDSNVEIDVYGGYKTEISKGLTLDVGLLQYVYPSNKLSPSANTLEIYGALTYGVFTAKYSHSTSNLFGFADSKGSGYLDLSAALDLGSGYTLTPHVGHQRVKNLGSASYTDYSVTLAKDYAGFTWSGAVIHAATDAYVGPGDKNLAKTALVLAVKKVF